MSEVVIAVRGEHTIQVPAQAGVVHVEVTREGPTMQPTLDAVATALAEIRTSLEALTPSGAVTSWSADQARTWSERPWAPDQTRLDLVHHASAQVTAAFADFSALGGWVSSTSAIEGVQVNGVEWKLTDVDAAAADRECRSHALLDARTRAQDYADALDLGPVTVRSINDPGVRAEPVGALRAAKAMMAGDSGGPPIEFTPQSVEVTAFVEATFVVDN